MTTDSLFCSNRLFLALLMFFGYICLYSLRVNMSIAIVCMVNQTGSQQLRRSESENSTNFATSRRCLRTTNDDVASLESGELDWSKAVQGVILSSFFWGYLTTQLLGGWLVTRVSAVRLQGACMLAGSVLTLLTPLAARLHFAWLLVTRILLGALQGVWWPVCTEIWGRWAPPAERGKLVAFSNAGAQVGNVLTFPLSGFLCASDLKWPAIFYSLGGATVVWVVFWLLLVRDSPAEQKRIRPAEREHIERSLAKERLQRSRRVPWRSILGSRPVWAMFVVHFASAWCVYTFLTGISSYMKEVLLFDIASNGLLSAVPYIMFWLFTIFSGIMADWTGTTRCSTTTTRKLFTAAGCIGSAVACLTLGFVDCSQRALAVAALSAGIAFNGLHYGAGFLVNGLDLSAIHGGVIFGMSNTFGTLAGIVAPYVAAVVTANKAQSEWRTVFVVSGVVQLAAAAFYVAFGSAEIQPWARRGASGKSDAEVPLRSNDSQF